MDNYMSKKTKRYIKDTMVMAKCIDVQGPDNGEEVSLEGRVNGHGRMKLKSCRLQRHSGQQEAMKTDRQDKL